MRTGRRGAPAVEGVSGHAVSGHACSSWEGGVQVG